MAGFRIGRIEGLSFQLLDDLLPQVISLVDRLDLVLVERAAHDEPHPAAVGDEVFNSTGGQGQGVGREVACHPVVLLGTAKGRDVEQGDQVAVIMAIAGFPGRAA